jgi:hypothetical protein
LKGSKVIRVPKMLITKEILEDLILHLRYSQESLVTERVMIRKYKPFSKITLLLVRKERKKISNLISINLETPPHFPI